MRLSLTRDKTDCLNLNSLALQPLLYNQAKKIETNNIIQVSA